MKLLGNVTALACALAGAYFWWVEDTHQMTYFLGMAILTELAYMERG